MRLFKNGVFNAVFGALGFIVGLLPFVMGYLNPDRQLLFSIPSLVQVSDLAALQLTVENRGKLLEKNVQVVFESKRGWLTPEDATVEKQILVDAKVPYTVQRDGDRLSVSISDLRPNDSVTLGVASQFIMVTKFSSTKPPAGVIVQSEERLAEYESGASFLERHDTTILKGLSLLLVGLSLLMMVRAGLALFRIKLTGE